MENALYTIAMTATLKVLSWAICINLSMYHLRSRKTNDYVVGIVPYTTTHEFVIKLMISFLSTISFADS